MSATGRPERELLPLGGTARSAKGAPVSPPGRPKGTSRRARHEADPVRAPGGAVTAAGAAPAPWLETLRLELRELVHYGFDDVGLERNIGITHKDNVASQRVLMKAGLADVGWGHYYGWRVRLFAARRDQQ